MAPNPDERAGKVPLVAGDGPDRGRVLDAEVLGPDEGGGASADSRARPGGAHWGNAGAPGPGTGWSRESGSGARFYRVGAPFSNAGGTGFGRMWTATGADGAGCLGPCITFALFFVCLSQFGLLAGIGFAVFHLVGGIIGGIRSMRRLVEGRQPNPWSWRLGNWFVSFMLTAWLAGALNR